MHPFPHHYSVSATASAGSSVALASPGLDPLQSAPPAEFDGPGDKWSPETLLVAAVADCFILTFRAIAAVSKLPWTSLACEARGTVERIDRVTQFTAIEMRATLEIPDADRQDQALRLLAKAEESCLVTNSLKFKPHLEPVVTVGGQAA